MIQSEIQYVYFYSNYIKRAFVRALRAAFEHEIIPIQYRYSNSYKERQINIWRDFPRRNERFPRIVVITKSGKGGMTYLGDEYSGELKEGNEVDRVEGPKGIGYLFTGLLQINIEIDIACKSLRDIEYVGDLTLFFVRHLFRQEFYQNNIAYVDIDISGQTYEDGLYKNKLIIPITTEFNNVVPTDLYEKITNVFVAPTPVINF